MLHNAVSDILHHHTKRACRIFPLAAYGSIYSYSLFLLNFFEFRAHSSPHTIHRKPALRRDFRSVSLAAYGSICSNSLFLLNFFEFRAHPLQHTSHRKPALRRAFRSVSLATYGSICSNSLFLLNFFDSWSLAIYVKKRILNKKPCVPSTRPKTPRDGDICDENSSSSLLG